MYKKVAVSAEGGLIQLEGDQAPAVYSFGIEGVLQKFDNCYVIDVSCDFGFEKKQPFTLLYELLQF